MQNDLSTETIITLSEAARCVPNRRGSRGINVSTLWRWVTRGLSGIHLQTLHVGGVRMTSREALSRFFNEVSAARNNVGQPGSSQRAAEHRIAQAMSEVFTN